MEFIKLTLVSKNVKDKTIFVNPRDITLIREDELGSFIAFSGGDKDNFITVKEDLKTVIEMINPAHDFEFSIQ